MAHYTHGHHESVLRSHRWRTAANSAGYLLPHLESGQRLLDVGCGPGTITADLAAITGDVTAVDNAPVSVDAPGVTFLRADVHALGFPDDAFDVVHAHQVLQHVADPVGALREMARVCRPGGLVAARDSDYAAFAWWPRVPELDEWLALYRRIARANGGEPDAGRRLLAWAHAAGLGDVTPSASTWCFATPDDRAWWGGLWAERVTRSALARQAVDGGFATEADLRRIADGWLTWAGDGDGWLTILHAEILCRV